MGGVTQPLVGLGKSFQQAAQGQSVEPAVAQHIVQRQVQARHVNALDVGID